MQLDCKTLIMLWSKEQVVATQNLRGGDDVQGIPSAWLLAGVGRSGLGVWAGRN